MSAPLIDLTGQRFGRYTVLRRVPADKPYPIWRCRCECGVLRDVAGHALRYGRSTQCSECRSAHLSRATRRFPGQPGDPCPCGKATRPGRHHSECPACGRRAARNGRYPCGHARYRTKPECPICPGGAA